MIKLTSFSPQFLCLKNGIKKINGFPIKQWEFSHSYPICQRCKQIDNHVFGFFPSHNKMAVRNWDFLKKKKWLQMHAYLQNNYWLLWVIFSPWYPWQKLGRLCWKWDHIIFLMHLNLMMLVFGIHIGNSWQYSDRFMDPDNTQMYTRSSRQAAKAASEYIMKVRGYSSWKQLKTFGWQSSDLPATGSFWQVADICPPPPCCMSHKHALSCRNGSVREFQPSLFRS